MGEGASCFRDAQIECAIAAFGRAAWEATTDVQRGQAAYNLGNSFFRQGDFRSAITLYEDALRYQPQQTTYQNNLAFSKEVQRNIELRLQQEAISQKRAQQKSGWREIDIDSERISDMNVTPGDKREEEQIQSIGINLTDEQMAFYMQRSQSFARVSSGRARSARRQHDWAWFSNENPAAARKVEYWQRLFELEEGIPAHPDTPEILLGVQPW